MIGMSTDLINRLREFLETEARSGSMDFGCVTPLYVYSLYFIGLLSPKST